MINRRHLSLGLFVCLLIATGVGFGKQLFTRPEEPEEDTNEFVQRMLKANMPGEQFVQLSGDMLLIDATFEKEQILEKHSFRWWCGGEYSAFMMDSVMVVQDSSVSVQVDHRQEEIVVLPVTKGNQSGWTLNEVLSQLREMNAKLKVESEDGFKVLTVDSISLAEFQGYRIFVDPQTYEVRKMLIGMNRLQSINGSAFSMEDADIFTYFLEIRYNWRNVVSKTEMPRISDFITIDPNDPSEFSPAIKYQHFMMAGRLQPESKGNNETE